ncbi:phosphotransferase [Halopenitus persicus]|uniref:phosphotransferase n=1 Tax=Halopenitus persicus TaxID=1048396 RepID=UPI000BBB3D64|nr:phosphotransferase [Halopenitus persicus]
MELQRLVRGRIDWSEIERVAAELADRYDRDAVHVRFLDADNWLSTPMVLDDDRFVKVITKQNTLVHALFTTGRNLGAFSSGTEGFFERFETPYEMARHELEATRKIRDLGVNAPEPIEALEIDGLGVLVLEYLPEFRSLEELDTDRERELAPALFETLRTIHDAGLAHGDLRAENVLILDGEIYVIDATNVADDARDDARAYDLASALASLEPLIGPRETIAAALTAYTTAELLDARRFLDFVAMRPDHDFDATGLKGELEKRATRPGKADSAEFPSPDEKPVDE